MNRFIILCLVAVFIVGCQHNDQAAHNNDPKSQTPTLKPIEDQIISEDGVLGPLAIEFDGDVSDVEFDLLIIESSNAALIPVSNIEISNNNEVITFSAVPVKDSSGETIISLKQNDIEGNAVSFKVSVLPVNDPPTISNIDDANAVEDQRDLKVSFTVNDIDSDVSGLIISARSSNEQLVSSGNLEITSSDGHLQIQVLPVKEMSGTTNIRVRVDDGELQVETSFKLTVTPINDPPVIQSQDKVTIAEDSQLTEILLNVSDIDTAFDDLELTASSSNTKLISSSGLNIYKYEGNFYLQFIPEPNAYGNTTITASVSDGDNQTEVTFDVEVTAVNDPPVVEYIEDMITYDVGGIVEADLKITDIDTMDGNLLISITSSNETLVANSQIEVNSVDDNHTILMALEPDQIGKASIEVQVSDGQYSESRNFTLDIRQPVQPDFSVVATKIAVGAQHACAIVDNTVRCWGHNHFGQLDIPNDIVNPRQISAGPQYTCVLADSGVHCWGNSDFGRLNIPVLNNPNFISVGFSHACAIDDEGVKCWGSDSYGKSSVPEGLDNPVMVAAGDNYTCALTNPGVVCWGASQYTELTTLDNPKAIVSGYNANPCVLNDSGVFCGINAELVEGTSENIPTAIGLGEADKCFVQKGVLSCMGPEQVWNLGDTEENKVVSPPNYIVNPIQVSVGYTHACVLDDNLVTCWGNGTKFPYPVPYELNRKYQVYGNPTDIVTFGDNTCALADQGLACWGRYDPGSGENIALVPYDIGDVSAVTVGGSHACAIANDGVKCWGGHNSDGQISPPVITEPVAISAGEAHTCAIGNEGVVCWGDNSYGQLNVPPLSNPNTLASGDYYTCAIDDNGLHCWGWNATRNADYADDVTSVPESVLSPSKVAAGQFYTCVIENSNINCWGWFGLGKVEFVDVGDVIDVGTSGFLACAVLVEGNVICEGADFQKGVTTPPSLTNAERVTVGDYYACALDDNGVQCWGDNTNEQTNVPAFLQKQNID